MLQKNYFPILAFFGQKNGQKTAKNGQKTAKIDQNEENWQNSNRLLKFSKVW